MTTSKGERTTITNIRGSRRGRMKAYSTDYGINGTSLPPRYYNGIPRRVRTVKDHHYLVVVDVGCNNQPLTRKEEVDNNMSRCYNSGLHR